MAQTRDELGKRRVEQLAEGLAEALRSDGYVIQELADLSVDVASWRAAGRRAGRILGWSVRTVVDERAGRVWLVDNRSEDELTLPERRSQDVRLRETLSRLQY